MLSVNEGLNTPYYYLDDFMFFEFDGTSSSTYNIFKINSGDDLVFHNSQNSSHEYVTPSYSNRTYYLGSKSGQKEFKWKCAGEGLTLPQIREVLAWLEEGKVGTLRDDHMGTWCYDVVVDSISDFNKWVQNDGTYIVEFDIGFKHIGNIFARGYYAAVGELEETTISTEDETITTDSESSESVTPETYTAAELVAVNEYGIPEVIITQNKNESGGVITGQYRIRVQRIGDKGYSMKCRTTFEAPRGVYDVLFDLSPTNSTKPIVHYKYKHNHAQTRGRCALEYNSNTNLVLLNGGFIEDNDSITIPADEPPVVNELKIQPKKTPWEPVEEQDYNTGMFHCLSAKRGDATKYTGDPSSTSYYVDIDFDKSATPSRTPGTSQSFVGYYDEYILTCTYTVNGGTSSYGATPTVEVTQYTIL